MDQPVLVDDLLGRKRTQCRSSAVAPGRPLGNAQVGPATATASISVTAQRRPRMSTSSLSRVYPHKRGT